MFGLNNVQVAINKEFTYIYTCQRVENLKILYKIQKRAETCNFIDQFFLIFLSQYKIKIDTCDNLGLESWCSMELSTMFRLYRGGQFYWWRKLEVSGENRPAASP